MVNSLGQAIRVYETVATSNGLSPRTVEWVCSSATMLKVFLGDTVSLEAITVQDVRRWVMALRERPRWANNPSIKSKGPLSSTSINNYVRGVKLLFSTLAREELIPPHPIAQMTAPKPAKMAIKAFSEDELRRIFKALGETGHPYRNRALVSLLFDPALRLSEAVGLKLANVDLPQRTLTVLGKGQKERQVPLSNWACKLILLYQVKGRPNVDSPYLFVESDGEPLRPHALQQILRRLGHRLGFRVNAHRFRHTGAIEYLRAGGDSLYLQALLGHSSLLMTQRYARIAGADLREAHRNHSPGDKFRL